MKKATNFKLIYPKQYAGYILWAILWTLLSIILLVSIYMSSDFELSSNLETVFVVSFLAAPCLYSINLILTCFFIVNKKIYLKYSINQIEFKGLYLHKVIKIDEINSIRKDSYKNILGYIVIKKDYSWVNISLTNIMFPMVWFAEKDIMRLIEFIKQYNNNIFIKGLYPNVYQYRPNKKND